MFNVPIESVTKGSSLRQKAKQAELACIAEGELVLTKTGLIPIEKISKSDRVWDGESWVTHDGVVCVGVKEVIEYEGLRATTDHLVWIEGEPGPVQFGEAASRRAHLIQTGNGRYPIRFCKSYQPRKKMEPIMEPCLRFNTMYGVRKHPMARLKQFDARKITRLPKLLKAQTAPFMARQTAYSRKAKMRKSERPKLPQLWRKRNQMEFPINSCGRFVDSGQFSRCNPKFRNRPDKYKWSLRTWKYPPCTEGSKSEQQAGYSSYSLVARILALLPKYSNQKTVRRPITRRNYSRRRDCGFRETQELEDNRSAVRVYDIQNAGRHHRFTVSGILVHNCGYGGSVGALKVMGALDMGLEEDELKPLVQAWRAANPNIVKLWWDVDRAALKAVREKTCVETHGILFSCQSGMLFITLPSSRKLSYVKPRIEINQFGSDCVTYEGVGGTKKWERIESYGPKFVENIIQSIARDLLYNAMNTLRNCNIVIHIHDEIVIEADNSLSVNDVCKQMSKTPLWAKGLPLHAEGFECQFYKKD